MLEYILNINLRTDFSEISCQHHKSEVMKIHLKRETQCQKKAMINQTSIQTNSTIKNQPFSRKNHPQRWQYTLGRPILSIIFHKKSLPRTKISAKYWLKDTLKELK